MREIAWRDVKIRVTAAVERLFVVEVALNEEHPSEDVESSWDRHRMVEVASVGCHGSGH